jgi:hypothetical protein
MLLSITMEGRKSVSCLVSQSRVSFFLDSLLAFFSIPFHSIIIPLVHAFPLYTQDNLLLYNHARLSSMEDGHSNAGSKDYLVSLMFSHYDLNNNGLLEAQELSKVYYTQHIDPPPTI